MFRRTERLRRGAAAVEFAVVLPTLLLLFLGMLESVNAIWKTSSLQNIARETARHAVTAKATPSSISATAEESFVLAGIRKGSISTTPTDVTKAKPGSLITVTATCPYAANQLVYGSNFLGLNKATATIVMRKE